jgi:hypothetical protein
MPTDGYVSSACCYFICWELMKPASFLPPTSELGGPLPSPISRYPAIVIVVVITNQDSTSSMGSGFVFLENLTGNACT